MLSERQSLGRVQSSHIGKTEIKMSDKEPIGAEEKVIDLSAMEMDEKGDDNLVLSRLLKKPKLEASFF